MSSVEVCALSAAEANLLESEAGLLQGAVDLVEFAWPLMQLHKDDFSAWYHRDIFEALRWVLRETGGTSQMAVRQRLLDQGLTQSCERLTSMLACHYCATYSGMKSDIEVIKAASLRRTVKRGIRELEQALNSDGTREQIAAHATAIMAACVIEPGHTEAEHIRPILETFADRRQELEDLKAAGQDTSGLDGLPSGLDDVDNLFRSLNGALIVVAGRPKMGKSVMGLQWAWHWSQFGPVYMWSGEMQKKQIADRLIGHAEQRPTDTVSKDSIYRLAKVSEQDGRRLHVDDERKMSACKLVARIEAFRSRNGLRAVVIDYLGLLAGNDYKEVSSAVRTLNQQAGSWNVPILLLCQLSRKSEDRIGNNEPRPADLRDSGQIEQEAHTVCLLHRPGYYDKTKDQGLATLDVALNRSGPSGKVDLMWLPQISTFQTRRVVSYPGSFPVIDGPLFEEMDLY